MRLQLDRYLKADDYTLGHLYIDGEYFCDTLEDKDRGLTDEMTETEITNIKVKGETAIPTGTYQMTLDVVSPKFASRAAYQFCEGKVPRLMGVKAFDGILIHCLTPETEILTELGWLDMKSFLELSPTSCYSYNTETGLMELVKVEEVIVGQYNGLLYKNEGRRINYAVTDRHRMWVERPKRDGAREWVFREAADLHKRALGFRTAGVKPNQEPLSPKYMALYRLLMATQADGHIIVLSDRAGQVIFHFSKQRKIDRIEQLVEQCGGTCRKFVDNVGKTHISVSGKLANVIVDMLNPNRQIGYKELPIDILDLNSDELHELALEYLFWDGRYENYLKNNKNMTISSCNKRTLDIIQAMCALCGMRSYIKIERPEEGNNSNCWVLVMYENQDVVMPTSDTYKTEQYSGNVWCVRNKNHTIVMRLNNRPMVVGNCGNTANDTAGCILVGEGAVNRVLNSTATFRALYARLLEDKDNLIITIQ